MSWASICAPRSLSPHFRAIPSSRASPGEGSSAMVGLLRARHSLGTWQYLISSDHRSEAQRGDKVSQKVSGGSQI